VERGDLDPLYLPRYVFGAYLSQRTREAVTAAAEAGTATTDVLHDEVVAVAPSGGGYEVRCRDQVLLADRIVLATGSPPVLARLHLADDVAPGAQTGGLVDDPFAGMAAAVDRVRDAVRRAGDRHRPHVVLIGGNAGTMDMLYQLNDVDAPELREAVFTVLSPRGELPACVADGDPVPAPFTPEHLDALADAEQIAAAAGPRWPTSSGAGTPGSPPRTRSARSPRRSAGCCHGCPRRRRWSSPAGGGTSWAGTSGAPGGSTTRSSTTSPRPAGSTCSAAASWACGTPAAAPSTCSWPPGARSVSWTCRLPRSSTAPAPRRS
jgi:hypothetical protein